MRDHALVTALALITSLALAPTLASGQDLHSTAAAWEPESGFSSPAIAGASGVRWTRGFGTPGADWINRVVERRDGSVLAVGYASEVTGGEGWEAVAHAFSADGEGLWTRRYGGPGLDAFWSAVELADGRLAFAGFSSSHSAGGTDLWLMITDAQGAPLTERRFGGAGDERATDVVATPDGLVAIGQSGAGPSEIDVLLVATDDRGSERWQKTYGGPGVERGFYGVATSDGGVVVTGVTGPRGAYDTLVLAVDRAGDERWRQVVGGEGNDPNHGVGLLADGRIAVVGYTASWGSRQHDLMATVFSGDGALLRHQVLGGPGDERVMHVLTGDDGGAWLIGSTTSFGAGGSDVMLARLDAETGLEPWIAALGTERDDQGHALAQIGDDLVIGGTSGDAMSPDLLLLRVGAATLERNDGADVELREPPHPLP